MFVVLFFMVLYSFAYVLSRCLQVGFIFLFYKTWIIKRSFRLWLSYTEVARIWTLISLLRGRFPKFSMISRNAYFLLEMSSSADADSKHDAVMIDFSCLV